MSNAQLAAVLFDMDGTLIDSEHYWLQSEQQLAATTGNVWTEQDGVNLIGMSLYDSTRIMKQKLQLPESQDEIIEKLTDSVISQLHGDLPWRPGALELLHELKTKGIKTALVTMSMRRMALAVAEKAGAFDLVVAGDDVAHGKPHPEPFLKAAELLGVDIRHCIAFEDSVSGLHSAEASGAIAVGVPNIVHLPEKPGRIIWPTLKSITVDRLIELHQEKRAKNEDH
jgi:HAD superfamily hydrolase (TIGR01509 family)